MTELAVNRGATVRRIGVLILLVVLGAVVHVRVWKRVCRRAAREHQDPAANQDIFWIFMDGQTLVRGQNPYSRIHGGDMRQNDKYATYLPVFYCLAAASQECGLSTFGEWVRSWWPVHLLFTLAVAALLYLNLVRRKLPLFAVLAAALWLFNRWVLHISEIAQIDHLAVFLLILSLLLIDKRERLAYLLFGLSLGVKQIGIFILPLYLIHAWLSVEDGRWRAAVRALLLIAVVPLLFSLPFLVWDPSGFLKSVLFSATRDPAVHLQAPSLTSWIGWSGPVAQLPLLLVIAGTSIAFAKRQIPLIAAAALIMLGFVYLNPVLFLQYLVWPIPLVLLAAAGPVVTPRRTRTPSTSLHQ